MERQRAVVVAGMTARGSPRRSGMETAWRGDGTVRGRVEAGRGGALGAALPSGIAERVAGGLCLPGREPGKGGRTERVERES